MLRTIFLAAVLLCAVVCVSSAEAKHRISAKNAHVACSDPVIRPCEPVQIGRKYSKTIPDAAITRYSRSKSISYQNSDNSIIRGARRPSAWCGWWLGRHLGMLDRKLWLARNWAHVGRPAYGPHIGAIVVWARGRRSGHVGIITGKTDRGWIVLSGNDGNAVRNRPRSVSNAIAFRWP